MILQRNKRKMKYANVAEGQPIYRKDDDGNIIYQEIDGELVPLKTGETSMGIEEPVIFYATITNKLSETLIKEFGVDYSTETAQITASRGYLPFRVGTLIWKNSEVGYEEDGTVDKTSCDYTVVGVADEGMMYDLFLLKRNVKT